MGQGGAQLGVIGQGGAQLGVMGWEWVRVGSRWAKLGSI